MMSDKTIAEQPRGYGLLTATEYRNQIIQELIEKAEEEAKDIANSADMPLEHTWQAQVAWWLKSQMDGPNAEPNRLADQADKIKDEARWVAFDDVCRAANKAGEDLPPSVRKLIGGAWADKHVRGGE